MPDETRVFDVTRPSHVNPTATSKPVIVGHQPKVNDTMVKTEESAPESTRIQITDEPMGLEPKETEAAQSFAIAAEPEALPAADFKTHETEYAPPASTAEAAGPVAVFDNPDTASVSNTNGFNPSPEDVQPKTEPPAEEPVPVVQPEPSPSDAIPPAQPAHIEGLHFSEPPRKRSWVKLVILFLLAALVGAYLAIDSGLLDTGIKLPFHVFKQETTDTKTPAVSNQTTNNKPATNTSSLPDGFKEYKLSGTTLTFAAPLAWGAPTSTAEPGYTDRGGDSKSTGTHAYLVTFEKNKDIEVALTSGNYLPATRTALYYDYLQWCTGTSDDKIYQSVLKFSTTNKVDTPTTITCDQGPLSNADKLSASVILQTKAKDAQGKALGDIYTMNLDNPDLVVMRVKDTTAKNGDDIKKLLVTIKLPQS